MEPGQQWLILVVLGGFALVSLIGFAIGQAWGWLMNKLGMKEDKKDGE